MVRREVSLEVADGAIHGRMQTSPYSEALDGIRRGF